MIVVFGSLMYALEIGVYTVNHEFPDGAYITPDGSGGYNTAKFNSMATALYYTVITMTTVGYGKL